MMNSDLYYRIVIFCIIIHIVSSITFPPSFTQLPPRNAVFVPSEAILLPCVAIGSPSPKYNWYKNGNFFNWAANTGRYTKWPDEGTLVIARPGTDDDGIYQCIASNQFGTALSNTINVKRAELGDFEEFPKRNIIVNYGEAVSLPCNVPLGFPNPVVTWQTEKNSQIQFIKETNRRAIDMNGYLYIAAAVSDDHNTEYMCVANNKKLRKQKNGPSYVIQVRGQPKNYDLSTLFRTPRTQYAVAGETLKLRCIYSGFPFPEYTWFKDGKEPIELPNVAIQNMGTMLEINPVTPESAGEYRCQGSNEVTQKTTNAQFIVHVQVRPTFVEEPEDVTVPVGGSVTFKCTATGVPVPQIRWTVNGEDPTLYLDGIRKVLHANTMQLTNLTVEDTAVVQCNASNAFGYAYKNAFVNVMREPPFIIKPPQLEVRAVDGNEFMLFCQTFSAPKAIISWTKDGRPITGGRYQILPSGDLNISSVAITDSGVYECTATNPFGSRKASGRLLVRRRTSIVLAPIDTQVYEGQVVKFVCTAETDPTEVENLRITWYKDDNLIVPELTPRIQQISFDYSLVLSGAEARDTGQYRCNASNGLDYAVATASLLVQGRPEKAIWVEADCVEFINEEIALVSWYPGSDNYAPIMEYIVEYSTQHERETWYPAEIFNYTGLVQSTSIKVVLRPAILYQFRVRTRNRVGTSLPSDHTTEICGISPRVPKSNPAEVYLYGSRRNNLIIRWTTLPYIEHYGNNLGYVLTLSCLDCDFIPRNAINNTVIGDWRTDRITMTVFLVGVDVYEIETYKSFRVTIQSRNEEGLSTAKPTEAVGYSGEAAPSLVPPMPTIINVTGQGAILQWNVISQANEALVNGYFRGYRFEWCPANLDVTQCSELFRYQDVILRIPNVPSLYNRRRRSAVHDSHMPSSEDKKESFLHRYFQPEQDNYSAVQSASPAQFSHICRSTKRKNISCPGVGLIPRSTQSKSILDDIYARPFVRQAREADNRLTTTNFVMERTAELPTFTYGEPLTYTLVGVPGATTVRVWLRLLNTRFAGPMSPTVTLTTLEDTPGPVANLQATAVSVTFVDVSWTPPTEPNGNVVGYQFEAMEMKGLELGFGFRYPPLMTGNATSHRLSRLQPNTTYRLTVWPQTSAGMGVDNFIDITTAPSDVAPNPPKFVVTTVGRTNFTVLFEPSQVGLPGTVFYVQHRQPGKVYWVDSIPTFSDRDIVVDGLISDTAYEVRMVVTNGAQLSAVTLNRVIRTLGVPGPDSLASTSGTWFIIICVLLIFFIACLVLLILLRNRRLDYIRERAKGPETVPETAGSPDYAQPQELAEHTALLSERSSNQIGYTPSELTHSETHPLSDDEDEATGEPWPPGVLHGTSDLSYQRSRDLPSYNSNHLDNDADIVDAIVDHQSPVRSHEEEAELELASHSHNTSEMSSLRDGHSYARQALSRREQRARATVLPTPEHSSAHSHISGDPTII